MKADPASQREERISVPLGIWKEQTAARLEEIYAKQGEKIFLIPAKTYLGYSPERTPGRRVGEYRVRRDGHSQHYFAVVAPKDFNPSLGSQGGWVPTAGPKIRAVSVKDKTLAFKPTLFLEYRVSRLSGILREKSLTSRNSQIAYLVVLGLRNLQTSNSWLEMPPLEQEEARTSKVAALRIETERWSKIVKRYKRSEESRTEFLRRLLWIGLQVQGRSPTR